MDQRKLKQRYNTRDKFTVEDRATGRLIGLLVNLSLEGARLITKTAPRVGHIYSCRFELPHSILAREKVEFDAECRWTRENPDQGYHESGYLLTNISQIDQEIISYLILRCVIDEWSNPSGEPATNPPTMVTKQQG